jgi:hypothetical protein
MFPARRRHAHRRAICFWTIDPRLLRCAKANYEIFMIPLQIFLKEALNAI